MKQIKLRTKMELTVALVFILLMVAISVAALTRTITDSSDNSYTFIRNSKGNYWECTGDNIQTAVDDLSTSGGTVYIPSGTFYFTSPLTPNDKVKLVGSGVDTTIIKAGNGFSDPNGYGLIKGLAANQFNNITISDITIDGNGSANCINFHTAKDCTFENLILRNAEGTALNIRDGSSRIIVSNLRIFNTTTNQGIGFNEVTDSIINNVIIGGGTGAGNQAIDISTGCTNITISNIIIYDTQ